MKNVQHATHNHKRMGTVVVLQSTEQLAQVVTSASDTFWVKVTELTKLSDEMVNAPTARSRQNRDSKTIK